MAVTAQEIEMQGVVQSLRCLQVKLPGALRFRFESALNHLDKAFDIIEVDREMASFRAITAEEEAATALIRCIQMRKYPYSNEFKLRDHRHKAAVMGCVMAIGSTLQSILKEFQLVLDYTNPRVDLNIPLYNFGVAGGENYAIQFVEPLDLIHTREGSSEAQLFDGALKELAERSKFESIKSLVAAQANARNTLLYASDSGLPMSKFTMESLRGRRNRTAALLVLTIMIWQKKQEQPLVRHAILAFLGIISRLPEDLKP